MSARSRRALVLAGLVVLAVAATAVLAELLMGAPLSDIRTLGAILVATGSVSLLAALGAMRLASRTRSLRVRIAVAAAIGLVVTLVNVLGASMLMFLSAHDLTLLLILLVFASVIALAFGLTVAADVGRDIERVSAAASRLAAGDLATRIYTGGADEIAQLGRSFDTMATRLEEAFARERAGEARRRELVTAISHDLRTPLTTTRAMIEAIQDGVVTAPEDVARYLERILGETRHMNRLIDDLFELGQLDSAQVVLRRAPVDLAALAREVVGSFEARAAERGIRVIVDVEMNAVPVDGDADRLRRVLRNLVDNALEHGSPGGDVRIAIDGDAERVQVSVSNDGPGIPASLGERVFEPFFRAEPSRHRGNRDTATGGGTGLGLAIARGLVDAHGGRIWLEPGVNGRTTFHVALPARAAAQHS